MAETLLRTQMFPSLATWETYVGETNFASRLQKRFLLQVKNIFVSRAQILLPKHMLPSLATMEAMLTSLRACVALCSCNIVSHSGSKIFFLFPANLATQET